MEQNLTPAIIDIGAGLDFFLQAVENHKEMLSFKAYPEDNEKVKALKQRILHEFAFEPYCSSNITTTLPKEFSNLEVFVGELFKCDEQLYHKLSCYFQSPIRVSKTKQPCTILTKCLEDLRNSKKVKIDSYIDPMERREQYAERTQWIKTLIIEAFGECKVNPPNYELEPGLVFKIGGFAHSDILYSNEKHRILVVYTRARFDQIKQLYHIFPSMLIQKVLNNPDQPVDVSYCFVIVTPDYRLHTCLGKFKKESKLSEIELKLSISSSHTFNEEVEIPFTWISHYINSQLEKKSNNFAKEALDYANCCNKNKYTLNEFYKRVFKTISTIKTTRKPTSDHLEFVKQKSEMILRDVTNLYRNVSFNTLNTQAEMEILSKKQKQPKERCLEIESDHTSGNVV